jgi:hypothetical protein
MTQGVAGHNKKLKFYSKTGGKPLKGFEQECKLI